MKITLEDVLIIWAIVLEILWSLTLIAFSVANGRYGLAILFTVTGVLGGIALDIMRVRLTKGSR